LMWEISISKESQKNVFFFFSCHSCRLMSWHVQS
jgi:hypothetical protein